MPLSINVQFNIIVFSLIGGIITGVMFDIYRIARGLCNIKIIVVMEDILFWILSGIIIFTFLLYVNYAFLTPYVYILMLVSVFFYVKCISGHFYDIEIKICSVLAQFFRIILKRVRYFMKIIIFTLLDKNY